MPGSSANTKKSVCRRRAIYKTQPFSERPRMMISRNWVSDSKGCGESGSGCSVVGWKGSKGADRELNPVDACDSNWQGSNENEC